MDITFEMLIRLGYKKIGAENWAVCDASNSNMNFTKNVNNEALTLKN
jgi:hypothetical protein